MRGIDCAPKRTGLLAPPLSINAHSPAKLWERLDLVSAHLECPKVEIARGACCAPAGILADWRDEFDGSCNEAVSKCGDMHLKTVAHLQPLDAIFAEMEP